jgi:hypothetical protein
MALLNQHLIDEVRDIRRAVSGDAQRVARIGV